MEERARDKTVTKRRRQKIQNAILDTSSKHSVGFLSVAFHENDESFDIKNNESDIFDKHSEREEDFTNIIAKPDKDGDNLLSMAIILRLTNIALMLIDLLSDHKVLSRFNNYFQTALHLATLINDSRLVRRLVVAGANVTIRDWRGDTPLHIACKKGYISVAEALLNPIKYLETKWNSYVIPYQQIPQNLEIRNTDGLTCFLIATSNRYQNIMELLLESGADVNTFDMKSGRTPLHIVAENGDTSLIKYLISVSNLNIDSKTYSGHTALHLARMRSRNHAEYLLLCAGAQDIDDITIDIESDLDSDSDDESIIVIT